MQISTPFLSLRGVYLAILVAFGFSCTTQRLLVSRAAYETCVGSEACELEGLLRVVPAEHGVTGKMDVQGGSCVNVSLPPAALEIAKRRGPIVMRVKGERIGDATQVLSDVQTTFVEYQGRRLGLGICEGVVVFVRDGDFQFID